MKQFHRNLFFFVFGILASLIVAAVAAPILFLLEVGVLISAVSRWHKKVKDTHHSLVKE